MIKNFIKLSVNIEYDHLSKTNISSLSSDHQLKASANNEYLFHYCRHLNEMIARITRKVII